MKTAACTHCSKKFNKPTQWRADLALSTHVRRAHPDAAPVPVKAKKADKPAAHRRPYRKHLRRELVQPVSVNYCPGCGCNLHAVATGIAMAAVAGR